MLNTVLVNVWRDFIAPICSRNVKNVAKDLNARTIMLF